MVRVLERQNRLSGCHRVGSVKLKVLGLFLGPLVTPEDNWRPRISAVEHVLLSWRQRSLSFRGKALIINALALSRIWYVASLVFMPPFVLRELNQLVFKFFLEWQA